jgi:hypothetical protein
MVLCYLAAALLHLGNALLGLCNLGKHLLLHPMCFLALACMQGAATACTMRSVSRGPSAGVA